MSLTAEISSLDKFLDEKANFTTEGDNVTMTKAALEHLLNCLDNQKFMSSYSDQGVEERQRQAPIDRTNYHFRQKLHAPSPR